MFSKIINYGSVKIKLYIYLMNFSSKLLQDAVDEISRLPGIGKNTATRLALNLIKEKEIAEQKKLEEDAKEGDDTETSEEE